MARLPTVDPAQATGSTKDIFTALHKGLGMVPNMTRVMANSPAVLAAFAQFNGALAGARLGGKVREMIALLSAEYNGCDYCLSAHTALGKAQGLSQSQLDGARHAEAGEPRSLAILQFALAVLRQRGAVTETHIAEARKAGLSDSELAEIVATVALNLFTNYFNRAFAVDVDFPLVTAHAVGLDD